MGLGGDTAGLEVKSCKTCLDLMLEFQERCRRPRPGTLGTSLAAAGAIALLVSCGAPAPPRAHSPAAASPSFAPAAYPPPLTPNPGGGASQDCPAPTGLQQQPSGSIKEFVQLVGAESEATSLAALLHSYDPALWPAEASAWTGTPEFGPRARFTAIDLRAVPAWGPSGGLLAGLLTRMCGQPTVDASWLVYFCAPGTPFERCDPGIAATTAVLERAGTWLTWYSASGYQS